MPETSKPKHAERDAAIVARWQAGADANEIAREFQLSRTKIGWICWNELGVSRRRGRPPPEPPAHRTATATKR
jgi:Mor family transcriptional regulator